MSFEIVFLHLSKITYTKQCPALHIQFLTFCNARRLQSAQNPFSVARPDQSWHDVETPKLGVPDAKPRTADAAAASQSPTAEARHKSPRSERTSQVHLVATE